MDDLSIQVFSLRNGLLHFRRLKKYVKISARNYLGGHL